jgi:hypothetical protein
LSKSVKVLHAVMHDFMYDILNQAKA